MTGLRVSELARRTGVTRSAVRFYERAGLLPQAQRAANGYRMFDESAVATLRLIIRAKNLGMSLEEISGLSAAWPDGDCASAQARIRGFLTGRIGRVREQRTALAGFEDRLVAALSRLPSGAASDGASGGASGGGASGSPQAGCGAGCGCEAALDGEADAALPAASSPAGNPGRWGCTLDGDALAARLSQWRTLAAAATSAEPAEDGIRLRLPADPGLLATAASLAAAETACCTQTWFLLEIAPGEAFLTAAAPGAPGLVSAMLAVPSGAERPTG